MTRPMAVVLSLLVVASVWRGEAQANGPQSQIVGTWRGNSECVVKSSPCRNETNVYRFAAIADRPGWYSGAGSKLVDGQEISMGDLDWKFDAKSHALEGASGGATFRLIIEADKIEGTLYLQDGTLYRRIHLTKAE